MSEHDDHPTLYADYICPFCYLEQQSVAEYRRNQENGFEVDWHPYDIRHQKRGPDGELDENEDIGYPDQVHQEIDRLKQRRDENDMLGLNEVPHVDSLPAQIVSLYVKYERPDQWFEFSDAVFEALWRDVGPPLFIGLATTMGYLDTLLAIGAAAFGFGSLTFVLIA